MSLELILRSDVCERLYLLHREFLSSVKQHQNSHLVAADIEFVVSFFKFSNDICTSKIEFPCQNSSRMILHVEISEIIDGN